MNFGDRIKQMRIKMNLTQEELANRCDLSKGFISQVERDLTSPSIATLVDILECLGSNLKDFFGGNSENEKIIFTKNDIFLSENAELGSVISWLIPNAQKNEMEPILINLAPGGRTETYPPSSGEIFGYVLSGSVILNLNGENSRVKKGESFYYKANGPHYIQNSAKGGSSLLWVSSPPSF